MATVNKSSLRAEFDALKARFESLCAAGTILTQGARELPPIPPRQNGQRGKVAKSDAHNLWERMQKHEIAVLRFAKHPDVAFTNNRAERDLRMAKVKQKVLFVTLFRSGFLGLFLIGRGSISHIVPPLSESRCGADWGRRPPW